MMRMVRRFPGEVNAGLLKEFSVRYVILGNSTSPVLCRDKRLIAKKAGSCSRGCAENVVCVGELSRA
jgi:triosephosphate isomerase